MNAFNDDKKTLAQVEDSNPIEATEADAVKNIEGSINLSNLLLE